MNWSSVLPLIAAYTPAMLALLAGMYFQNRRFDDLKDTIKDMRAEMNRQFADSRDLWRAELRRVEEVLDARLKHLEER